MMNQKIYVLNQVNSKLKFFTRIFFTKYFNHLLKRLSASNCKLNYNSAGYLTTELNMNYCEKECGSCEYKCYVDNYCITLDKICDGISHCPYNDDETGCGKNDISSIQH